ncbi:MAG: RNA methyltransferase [Clostridiales bacterium]|nr:RNA methyltransferase [Clostridiales bacterium]
MYISSKDNKIIKYVTKLILPKYSKIEGKTLVESPKIISELLDANMVEYILVTDRNRHNMVLSKAKCDVIDISDSVMRVLSTTETSTGIFAVVKLPQKVTEYGDKSIILDGIQDPSNLGAIIRSAVAFGYNTIFTINSCYAYSPKVIRSSMGTIFKVNMVDVSYDEVERYADINNVALICCDMNGKSIENTRPKADKFAIIIGSEGGGVSDRLRRLATTTISIPMQNGVESLNASVSAGIIMYYLK